MFTLTNLDWQAFCINAENAQQIALLRVVHVGDDWLKRFSKAAVFARSNLKEAEV